MKAIFLKKLNVEIDSVVKSINSLDLKSLSLEKVEILQKMIPTDDEVKLYRKFSIDKRDANLLTEEDKFMMQLTKVERLTQKLYIMSYMGNFFDYMNSITPVSSTLLFLLNMHYVFFYFSKFLLSRMRQFR